MPLVKDFLFKYRWWILIGSSLAMFTMITLLALAVLQIDTSSPIDVTQIRQPSQYPSEMPVVSVETAADQFPTLTPPPAIETKISEIPSREVAFVQRVIDGDSIEVILDGVAYNLRYIGIDAPETGMPFFNEATEANRQLVEGQIVELEHDITNKDQYGRLLRYIYLSDGRLVNAELVKLGLAGAKAYPPDIKYQEIIASSESAAIAAGIGLWAPELTPTPIIIFDISMYIQIDPLCSQFNAPGNDNHNKNEEYVCIVNTGSEITDMTGWSIHDDYGWTYYFPSFGLVGGTQVIVLTGCGSDSSQELYWCKDETAVWNNDGDCVNLLDGEGIEAAIYCY